MHLPRRDLLSMAAGAVAASALPRLASALDYPVRPVRIFEGFGGGGTPDLVSRLIGQWLAERLGQPFVVENRTGAAGNLATQAVVTAAPDGYTLLTCLSANAVNTTLYEKLDFNFLDDMAPVAGLVRLPMVLLVNPSFPATTLAEFIAYAKANPGKINMASPGIGTPMHVAGELFKMMTAVNIVHVPNRGPAGASGGVARRPRDGRIAGRFRGDRLGRHLRAGRHAGGDRRQAQRHHHRRPRRSAAQGEDQGFGR